MKFKLFISYNGHITGFGWTEITIDLVNQIGGEELIKIQNNMRKNMKDNSIIILFWKLLGEGR